MEFTYRFVFLFQLLWLCNSLRGDMKSSKSYSLSKSCKSISFGDEYSRKSKFNINLTGAIVRSHEDYLSDSMDNGIYPDNLSCELVAEAPVSSRIMLLIENLHIPTDNSLCDENYLYVFDHESSRSKAMAAAGGEKGLCGRTFPRYPIITTGPYMTFVFNSKMPSRKVPNDAGFLLILTEIKLVEKGSQCQPDFYQCGPILSDQRNKRGIRSRIQRSALSSITSQVTLSKQIIPKSPKSSIINYCIPMSLVCDGVRNCHDGSDEDSRTRKFCSDLEKVGIINKFLSLGLTVSIAIAVSCIIGITLCIGFTARYCVRLCTSGISHSQAHLTKEVVIRPEYQGMVISPPVQGVNLNSYYTSNYIAQPFGFIPTRDNSSASSFETDKMYSLYQDPLKVGYGNSGHPSSEKMCHWGTSSLLSYPSNSDGHHSHPETPYFMRDASKNDRSPRHIEHVYRPSLNNSRGHHNSCNHQTPTSSRSAKSTRSTKSSNVDKKNAQTNETMSINCNNNRERCRKYPLTLDESKARILGPVLGQL